MMWWYGNVFINRQNPEDILLTPAFNTDDKPRENTVMLKIKLLFTAMKAQYENYVDLRETRRALKPLDDHLLSDIGLERSDWNALMEGEAVTRQRVLSKLSKRQSVAQTMAPVAEVLPEKLPELDRGVVANAGEAVNDCEACAA